MRTDPEVQKTLYNCITLQEAARRLGVSPDHVLDLGRAGELSITDLRLPGAKRGVYRVDPAAVESLKSRRTLGRVA